MYDKEFYRAAAEDLVIEDFNEDAGIIQYSLRGYPYIYDSYREAVEDGMQLLKEADEEANL